MIHDLKKKRRERDEAAIYLRNRGATDVRGVYHKRPGWWSANNVFLGSRAIEARIAFERLNEPMTYPDDQRGIQEN